MDNFFAQLELPGLSEEHKTALNSSITKTEVLKAINKLQNGKSPGPDGFCCEFYKQFQNVLVDPLLDMFNHSFTTGEFPRTLKEANVSLILKKGKCSDSCGSYRPIALLNVDRKLLSKILASRLKKSFTYTGKGGPDRFCKGSEFSYQCKTFVECYHSFWAGVY